MPPCYGGGMSSSDAAKENAVQRLIADFDRQLAENLKAGGTSVLVYHHGAMIHADAVLPCCVSGVCGFVSLWLDGRRIGSAPASDTRVAALVMEDQ